MAVSSAKYRFAQAVLSLRPAWRVFRAMSTGSLRRALPKPRAFCMFIMRVARDVHGFARCLFDIVRGRWTEGGIYRSMAADRLVRRRSFFTSTGGFPRR